MLTTMGGCIVLFLSLLLINLTDSLPLVIETEETRIPVKRFNFNFLRTWQPLTHAEPFGGDSEFNSMSAINSKLQKQKPSSIKQKKIRQKLMCIAALQSTKACSDLNS